MRGLLSSNLKRQPGLAPNAAEVRNDLGLALRQNGAVEQAIHEFRLCLQLEPQYAAAHYNLALALQDAGQAESAATELRIARKLDPTLPAQ